MEGDSAEVGNVRVAAELAKVVLDAHLLALGATACVNVVSVDCLEVTNEDVHGEGRTPAAKLSNLVESDVSTGLDEHVETTEVELRVEVVVGVDCACGWRFGGKCLLAPLPS